MAEHHSKKRTGKLLKHWKQECKSTEVTEKDEFKKRAEWFKENWKVEKLN